MIRAAFLSLTVSCAVLACACSNDETTNDSGTIGPGPAPADSGTTQSMSPVGAGSNDGGTAPSMDAGHAPTSDAGPAAVVDTGVADSGPFSLPDTGVGADTGVLGDAAMIGDAGAIGDGGGAGSFGACTAALKPVCNYDDKETACASIKTPVIPLSNGMKWGGTELKQGPYGSYVEWNEGMAFANVEGDLEFTCPVAAAVFGEPQSVTDDVLDLRGQDLKLYTVFRPACMKEGEKYPVITWGNGTCGQSGGYAGLLATVASHGFVVFASNSRWTDEGRMEMLKALDFAKAANEDPKNPLFGRLDMTKVGAMGHSQGASATAHAATDARIKSFILWNGASGSGPAINKPFMAVSGDRDISGGTPMDLADSISAATQPAAWLWYHKVLETGGNVTGHLTLMMQAERVWEPTVAWWKYILNGDAEAKKMFAGTDCGLCNKKDDFEFGAKNIQ